MASLGLAINGGCAMASYDWLVISTCLEAAICELCLDAS